MTREKRERFDRLVLPHVAAGYNLARWLLRNEQDAEDAVQTACLRAFQSLDGFRGSDGRPWFLTIVRRSCLNIMRQRTPTSSWEDAAEEAVADERTPDPEQFVLRSYEAETVRSAMHRLHPTYREILFLRELQGLSYKEISEVIDHPIGTVMSRLSKARKRLQLALMDAYPEEAL